MKEYIIDSISKETLEEFGYDSSRVNDETMKKIAGVLRNTFRECVLVNLPQIAEDYEIPKSTSPYYTVSRVYVSLNDENGNSHDTDFFKNRDDAISQLSHWRSEEMKLRKESECDYQIFADKEDFFRMAWDDQREMLSISVDHYLL